MAVDIKIVFALAVLTELSHGFLSFGSYDISDASLALARFRRSAFHQDDLLHSRVKRELKKIRGANGPYGYHPIYIADEDDEEGEGEEPAPPEGIPKVPQKEPTSTTARRTGRGGGSGGREEGELRQKGKKKKRCRCRHSSSEESDEDRGGKRRGSRRSEESEEDSSERRRRRRRRKKKKQGEEEASENRGPRITPSGTGAPSGKIFKPSSENGMSVTGFHELFIGDESDEEDVGGGGGAGGGPFVPQGGRGTKPSRSKGYGRGFGRRTASSEDDDDEK